MITFDHVVKRRGAATILDDVGFEARAGRVTGFVGRNGAGKSSALRILLGLDRATAGAATIGGAPYASLRRPLTRVGVSLGGAGAHPGRTAAGHLGWLASSNGISRSRVGRVLDELGLAAAGRRRVGTFSLGMAQRLGLAAALLGEPEVLVLDEPVNGLDPDGIRWLRGLVRRHAADGGTVLMSSHLITELAEVADDVVIIDGGRIRASAPVEHLVAAHGGLETAFFAVAGEGSA
ncbi:adenosinetriphosphatase [Propionibacterium ruminifibrarum]|uniref:Adenosinetriphosphatase n=1 Tax=Propionibacterium ruminifibrarum TaxID=1962131 RepID=A0A375I1C3_9ACTN|nr:ATP-binding cassette domain-containing protein [Propionibacterium ruminifibrarum]SPF68604.1 adenosinetriphosphatase [Propionibacterium ruminifibrarum]